MHRAPVMVLQVKPVLGGDKAGLAMLVEVGGGAGAVAVTDGIAGGEVVRAWGGAPGEEAKLRCTDIHPII